MSHRRDQRGAAVVTSVLLLGVLLVLAIACAAVVGLIGSHRKAEAAADLAALAGASSLQDGGAPCTRAAAVATANQAALVECRVHGFEVAVVVRVRSQRWLGERIDLRARARAGPVAGAAGHGGLAPSGQ